MVTVVAMVSLAVFGLFALWRLQTDEYPEIQHPVVMVGIPYPGGSPQGVEREILKPVEDAIRGIAGVDQVFGTAYDGYAQIVSYSFSRKTSRLHRRTSAMQSPRSGRTCLLK